MSNYLYGFAVLVALSWSGNCNSFDDNSSRAFASYQSSCAFVKEKNWEKARQAVNQAIALDANYADAYRLRAQIHVIEGQYQKAVVDFTATIRLNAQDPLSYMMRGAMQAKLGDSKKALGDMDVALTMAPDSMKPTILYNRGVILAQVGDHDRAIADYTAVLNVNPRHVSCLINRAASLWEKKSHTKALIDYDAAIKLDPSNYVALEARGCALYKLHRWDESLLDLNKAIQLQSNYAKAFRVRSKVWLSKKDLDNALKDANTLIALAPKDAQSYGERGNIWAMRKEWKRAIADYGEALRLSSGNRIEYRKGLVTAYMNNREWHFAIANATELLRLEMDADIFSCRGVCRERLGNSLGALDDYSAAIMLAPNCALYWRNRAILYETLRQSKHSIRDFSEAIRLDPKSSDLLSRRGRLLAMVGLYEKAKKDFDESIRIDAKSPTTLAGRAWFHAGCPDATFRDATRAVADAKSACELSGWNDPWCLEAFAAACAESGSQGDAVKWQRVAISKASTYSLSQKQDAKARLEAYDSGRPFRFTSMME